MRYVPATLGARSVKVKVATSPGATTSSTVVPTRFGESQFVAMPRSKNVVASPTTPRFAWASVPRRHSAVPVLRKWIVYVVVSPEARVGYWL
ncbi:MAG: hypothetical protein AUH85_17580 [Chloroflexi bacterium 13_1_40CM_4_68_4]|nr:MAG: hypothetical protein AUH85_17580 [Chloroflexi bacterium 13_1_40CM_4_68_4]